MPVISTNETNIPQEISDLKTKEDQKVKETQS